MSRDEPPEEPPEEPAEPAEPRLRLTPPAAVVVCVVVGLVVGWAWRPLATVLWGTAPLVSGVQVAALAFLAAAVGGLAWTTWRDVQQRRRRLPPHQAVNRLLIGKAATLTGAVLTGGYGGYALAFLGLEADLAHERIVRSLLAALAGAALVVGAQFLERACRTPDDEDADLP